ncbi:MAG: hypothetical protein LQ347_001280 [Umbilicaria vellea]|nr:MAG: hypothetical protein LQ347_001280 [Umbilicaria vellea]
MDEEVNFAQLRDTRKIICILRPIRADLLMYYDASGLQDKVATWLLVDFDPQIPAMFHTWKQGRADTAQGVVSSAMRYKNFSLYRGWTITQAGSNAGNGRTLMHRSLAQDQLIDIKQLKELLHTCKSHHPDCDHTGTTYGQASDSTHIKITLLDVITRKIVVTDPQTRFVALSYVWDYLDRDGYQGFAEEITEGSTVPRLPCMMEDAVTVTKRLGQTFLWIDLLCINQIDPTIRKIQMKQMDMVYSHAEFTIVALSRNNVHNGLPGVRPNSRRVDQYNIRIDRSNLVLSTIWNHFYTIAGSTWNSRGWTLVEGLLSRRCLFFGPHEVLFECRNGIGSETLGLPVSYLPDQTTVSLRHIPGFIDYKFWNKSLPTRWNFAYYAENVRAYSERDLSHRRDSLNAFAGFLNRLSHFTKMPFNQGLPQNDLLNALLWFPRDSDSSRISEIPSWSWAGWTGLRRYFSVYQEIIDKSGATGCLDTEPYPQGLFCKISAFPQSTSSCKISISSQIRSFRLSNFSSSNYHRLVASDGGLMLRVLGPTQLHEDHDPNSGGNLFQLRGNTALACNPTHFMYILQRKDLRKKMDHVLAMLLQKMEDGTFERAFLCGIPLDEWNAAPVIEGLENIVLV